MSVSSTLLLYLGKREVASARWKATGRSLPLASTMPKRAVMFAAESTGIEPLGRSMRTEAMRVAPVFNVIAKSSPLATPLGILMMAPAAKAVGAGIGAAGFLATPLTSVFLAGALAVILADATGGAALRKKVPAGESSPFGCSVRKAVISFCQAAKSVRFFCSDIVIS